MTDYAYSMDEVMPKLRACLFAPGSHAAEMGTYAECYDALCRLESLVDEFREMNPDADLMSAVHGGANLGAQLKALRDAMQMGLGITVPDLLVLVKEMIEQAIGVHEDDMHTDEEHPPSSREMGDRNMADDTKTLRETSNSKRRLPGWSFNSPTGLPSIRRSKRK
jgi:hypothetical protein